MPKKKAGRAKIHTAASTAPAYDVDLRDALPAGLEYVPGSAEIVRGPAGSGLSGSDGPAWSILHDDDGPAARPAPSGEPMESAADFDATQHPKKP